MFIELTDCHKETCRYLRLLVRADLIVGMRVEQPSPNRPAFTRVWITHPDAMGVQVEETPEEILAKMAK